MKNRFLDTFRKAALVLLAAAFLALSGCSRAEKGALQTITLMTWNVHNLFDGNDDGYEYNEFLAASGWSTEKYLGRINAISAAIGALQPQPDIIALQEIESLAVVEQLASALSSGYSSNHFGYNDGSAIGLGIISRFPLESAVHSITINGDTAPRPILEARVKTETGEFVIFACHWKSKIGGDTATEKLRKASARIILRRIRELWEIEPELGVIVAGDLNENHDEYYRQNASAITALLPADIYAQTDQQKDFIVITGNKPPESARFPKETIALYSPWINELENGSYYYRNKWETIDHFLISRQFFNNAGWQYDRTVIVDFPPFANSSGKPFSYIPKTGIGLSDHFPLMLILKRAEH